MNKIAIAAKFSLGLQGLNGLHAGRSKPQPIAIGFCGQLSGAYADLGIKGRDGATLAAEKLNKAGGIAGRPIPRYPL